MFLTWECTFNSLDTKTLKNQQSDLCENEIRETDLFDSMKSMKNNKTPGNDDDGLTKEFYETFWDELKLLQWKVLIELSTLKS